MNLRKRVWKMAVKTVGETSPPKSENIHVWINASKTEYIGNRKRGYGGLRKFGVLPIKQLNCKLVRLTSLGSIGMGNLPSSWRNPPNAPPFRSSLNTILRMFLRLRNPIGTIQGQITYWKGQKRYLHGVFT